MKDSFNTGKIGLGLTIIVLDKPLPTVASTVEVKDDDISILQVHGAGNLITMLCLLKNRIFSSAVHCSSEIIENVRTIFETSDIRLLDALCDVNTEGKK